MIRSSHRSSNKEKSQYSIIFVLASQYRSHSVPSQSAHTDLKILQWNAGGMSQNKKTELHEA